MLLSLDHRTIHKKGFPIKFLFLSTLLLSTTISAKFYLPETLDTAPENLSTAIDASVRYKTWYKPQATCSSVMLSNDGHVLTNLHCLKKCFAEYPEKFEIDHLHTKQYDVLIVQNQAPNAVCKSLAGAFRVDIPISSDSREEDSYSDPTVVWLGKGKANFPDDTKIDELPADIFQKMLDNSDDYAILKFDVDKKTKCIPLAEADPKAGDALWSIGYPSETKRNDGFDSTGWKEHISRGILRSSIADDPNLSGVFGDFYKLSAIEPSLLNQDQKLSLIKWEATRKLWDQDRFLNTDLDAMDGSSGSMIINDQGKLVGTVFTGIFYPNLSTHKKKETGSTVVGLKASHIYNEVLKGLGEEEGQKVFNCQN